MAEMLTQHGIRAFVLRYRLLPKHDLNDALEDFASALAYVRKNFRGPVAAVGFSAGGHLVASSQLAHNSSVSGGSFRRLLDAQVLVYPCIDGIDWAHEEWCGFCDWDRCYPVAKNSLLAGREALMGGPGFAAPPTFLVASTADEASPPKDHSDVYARALRKRSIDCTYLRRDFGAHGFGLDGGWAPRCLKWLRGYNFGMDA